MVRRTHTRATTDKTDKTMSLDVTLTECRPTTVFSSNITHNLGKMAQEAGIYEACWRPEEIGVARAWELIPLLQAGIAKMKERPSHFKQFDAKNGWGTYDQFLPWLKRYLAACEENPEATVSVSR